MINLTLLQTMIHQGFISCKKHDDFPLYIYNYTPKAQYERMWNEVTLSCRGLILDKEGSIQARPFRKFFNLEECESIPAENFEVFEKMDGSLGILYWVNKTPYIATRGSFHSEQAVKATQLLHTVYRSYWGELNPNYTYLFEIIYPDNRVVVNYGDREALVLLAVIHTQTGREVSINVNGFPIVKRYDNLNDIFQLKALQEENREGFVIRFEHGFRLKVKFDEYIRLHFLLTQVSSRTIWEYLANDLSLEPLLQTVPDEYYQWIHQTINDLQGDFQRIEDRCKQQFKILENRKETAHYFLTCEYPGLLFLILDGKPYKQEIWKRIKPTFAKPFKTENK